MSINWRRWNRVIHRDLGYLCFGLTVVYAVSGVALNHIHDWNSNYRVDKVSQSIEPFTGREIVPERDVPLILQGLGEINPHQAVFRPDPDTLMIFMGEGRTITVNARTGEVQGEVVRKRPVFSEMNVLHLNRAGRFWTWFADLYAAALFLLAVTGLFILRGGQGLAGRGGWLTAAGVVVPLLLALLLL